MRYPSRHRISILAGFTLVEMFIVFAIIMVISALTYTIAKVTISNAKDSATISNLSQIGKSAALYCADHDDYFPPFVTWRDEFNGAMTEGMGARLWTQALAPYGARGDVWFSNSDPYRKQRVYEDIPGYKIRPYTSFAHTTWIRRFRLGDFVNYTTNSTPNPSAYIFLSEEGCMWLVEGGIMRQVPCNGKNFGCLMFDGSAKRMTWEEVIAPVP